jgi:hypothetical protein
MVPANAPLIYPGPQSIDEMWESGRFIHKAGVKIQRNKIIRTRPMFKEWSADIEIHYLQTLLNDNEIKQFVETAGQLVGLGDWRPKFGRFTAERINQAPQKVLDPPVVPNIGVVPLI